MGQALTALGELGTGLMTDGVVGFVEGGGLGDLDLEPSFEFVTLSLAAAQSSPPASEEI